MSALAPVVWVVYFVRCLATGLVKIGYSKNPKRRRSDGQVFSGGELVLLGSISGGDSEATARGVERAIQAQFADYHHHGEWFDLPHAEVVRLVPQAQPLRRKRGDPARMVAKLRSTRAAAAAARAQAQRVVDVAHDDFVRWRAAAIEQGSVASRGLHAVPYEAIGAVVHRIADQTGRRRTRSSWEYEIWLALARLAEQLVEARREAIRAAGGAEPSTAPGEIVAIARVAVPSPLRAARSRR